jgi:hypothetical protein
VVYFATKSHYDRARVWAVKEKSGKLKEHADRGCTLPQCVCTRLRQFPMQSQVSHQAVNTMIKEREHMSKERVEEVRCGDWVVWLGLGLGVGRG